MLHQELADAILAHLAHYLFTGLSYSHYFIQPSEQLSHHPSETIPVTRHSSGVCHYKCFPLGRNSHGSKDPESSVSVPVHTFLCTSYLAHRHTRACSAAGRPGAGVFKECLVKVCLQPAALVA